jgi:hypothetical protein
VNIATLAAWVAVLSFAGGCVVALVKGVRYARKWWRERRPIEPGVWVISEDDSPPSVQAKRERAQVTWIE